MIFTKYIKTKGFDYMNTWGDILTSVAWAIKALQHSTFDAQPAQLVFSRKYIFNLTSVIDWHVIHARKQKQVDRDNIGENNKMIFYDYIIGDQVLLKIKASY